MSASNTTPEWLTAEFFQNIIGKEKCKEVKKFSIAGAAKEGEHIGGNVLRAKINYVNSQNTLQTISIIIKYLTECENKLDKKYKIDLEIFNTELKMYSNIIPKFEKMLKTVGDNTALGPRLLYSSEKPYKVIILEDLSTIGYVGCNNLLDNPEFAIDKLAKWHACSYKLNYDNNGCLEKLNNSVFKTNEHDTQHMSGGIQQVITVLKPLANKNSNLKSIIEKLEKIEGKVYKKCTNLYEYSRTHTKLNALNHGDFHIKNLLFKYDIQKNIEDIQILDFALCFWGSMAFDLIYILYAIYSPDKRNNNRDEIIYNYFKKFENCLKLIGFNGKLPKLSDLLYDINNIGEIEIWLSTTFLPFVYGFNRQEDSNIAEFIQQEAVRLAMYKMPEYLNDIQILLRLFLNHGFLDESYYVE